MRYILIAAILVIALSPIDLFAQITCDPDFEEIEWPHR